MLLTLMNRDGRHNTRTRWLQALLACAILLSLCNRVVADTHVRVEVPGQASLAFLVSVSTHHGDFHNGYSRTRFRDILASNERHRIDTGFYFTLTHYSAWSYHPDYLMAETRSEGRLGPMPDIKPRSWQDIFASMAQLPITGSGPTYARAAEHVRLYPEYYLPALDRAGIDPAADVLAQFDKFLARSAELAGLSGELSEVDRRTALRLQGQVDKSMAQLRLQLSLNREQRQAARQFRELIAGPKPMIEALVKEPGLASVSTYLAILERAAEMEHPPEEPAWRGEHVDVEFSYRQGGHYGFRDRRYENTLSCYQGWVQFDGRHLAGGLDPDLVSSVQADFCRYPHGEWRLRSRWAPDQ